MNEQDYLLKYKGFISKEDQEALKKGYPVQYLVGHVDFFNVSIAINQDVLIPRFETEFLVAKIIEYLKKNNLKNQKILEIGTGSGCIAIALKKERPDLDIVATDISSKALALAKINAENNNVKVNFILSDLFEVITEKFDIIVSNPPYLDKNEEIMAKVRNFEPHQALFADDNGMALLKKIIKEVPKHINKNTLIALEIGEKQGKTLKEYAQKYFPDGEVLLKNDMQNKTRYIFIRNNCKKT